MIHQSAKDFLQQQVQSVHLQVSAT
jgi:hypothetical protein